LIRQLLEADYAAHPESYGPDDGKPGDPFFHRRARNLYTYARNNGRLRLEGTPRIGDVVFLSRRPQGWITHLALVCRVDYAGRYVAVEVPIDHAHVSQEITGEELVRRGWTVRGFGDLLGAAARHSG
jgi:hypothetical protein